MHKFVRGLITEWRSLQLPFEGATFVVAVSGGADSVSLLLALDELSRAQKLQNRFVAAHFNHGLRGDESDTDEEFVTHLAGLLKSELALGKSHLPHHGNLEQNARDARYRFLTETAENISAQGILTAHTVNDQAETFLMNLIRGSGPDGLAAMRPVREMSVTGERSEAFDASGSAVMPERKQKPDDVSELGDDSPLLPFSASPLLLVRPLLIWAQRRDTEAYCHAREVEYRYDSMNEDLSFTRVRIRKLLLPMLEEFNPKIIETLANTSRLMRVSAKDIGAADTLNFGDELEISRLKNLEKPVLYEVLRKWLAVKRGNTRALSLKHIEAIERLALSRKSGRQVELPEGAVVVKAKGMLSYRQLKVEKRPSGI